MLRLPEDLARVDELLDDLALRSSAKNAPVCGLVTAARRQCGIRRAGTA